MASILPGERTRRLRYGKRKRQAASGSADPRDGRRRLKRDGIHGPGIAALMAEAGLAGRHRTAGRAAVRET